MNIFHYFTPVFETAVIAVVLNYLLSFFWNTRSMDLILGLFAFLSIFAASSLFDLPILHKLMLLFANVAVIAILIIFQPELRVALSKLSLKGRRFKEVSEFETFLTQLCSTLFKFAGKRIGAIVVLENEDSLAHLATVGGTTLNARFSPELLNSIFLINSPLHDGAVIISGNTIVSAGVILPLADELAAAQLKKTMGTRHRAALGVTQHSEAIAIVVSEETGKVSVAKAGTLIPGVLEDQLRSIIKGIYAPNEKTEASKQKTFYDWIIYFWKWIKE